MKIDHLRIIPSENLSEMVSVLRASSLSRNHSLPPYSPFLFLSTRITAWCMHRLRSSTLLIKRYKGPVLLFVWRPLENATIQRIRNTIFNDTSRKSLWSRNKQLAMEIRKEENTQSIPWGWKEIIVNRSSNEIE